MSLIWYSASCLCVVFLLSQAALQKQQQVDSMMHESSNFSSGDTMHASAAGQLCAASPAGEELPTLNGGQSDTYSESMDREPEPEPAEEVSENGPLLGRWAGALLQTHSLEFTLSGNNLNLSIYRSGVYKTEGDLSVK